MWASACLHDLLVFLKCLHLDHFQREIYDLLDKVFFFDMLAAANNNSELSLKHIKKYRPGAQLLSYGSPLETSVSSKFIQWEG